MSIRVAPSQIAIEWRPPIEGPVVRYRIYSDLGMGSGVYTLLATVAVPRYVHHGLKPATTYRYFVATWEGGSESPAVPVEVTTPNWLWPWKPSPAAVTLAPPTLPLATAVPTITPLSTPVVLDISQGRDFTDDLNVLHIVGELHNPTKQPVEQMEVVATFYDRSGRVIAQTPGEVLLKMISPGDSVPFHLTHPAMDNLWKFSLRATARVAQRLAPSPVVVLYDRTYKDDQGFYHVVGKVVNHGERLVEYPRVVVTLYDPWGTVVNSGFVYTSPHSVAPSESASFDAYFAYFPQVETYRVQIWSP
jgi:hypothetical protein